MATASLECTPDEDLSRQLEQRHLQDQKRLQAWRAGQEFGRESTQAKTLWAQQQRIDAENLAWLQQRVREHGWPDRCAIGEKGSQAFFLIAQHGDMAAQKQLMPALEAAIDRGQASKKFFAYMDDRIRVEEGKPQRFGTQWTAAGELYPVEDPATLEVRRAALGLGPAADSRPGS